MPLPTQQPTSSDGVIHTIHDDGSQTWHKNGIKHRDNDLPAEIDADGTQRWYQNGQKHRDNGPAFVSPRGEEKWYQHGALHRDNGPADIRTTIGSLGSPDYSPGHQSWYQHGQLHRVGGPANITPEYQHWYQNGQLHRDDGPAVDNHGGLQLWYQNGKEIPPPAGPGTPLEVKLGTNKIRQLRDTIAARGGTLSRKDLPQQLPPELKPLLGPRGDLSADSIQNFLDKKPGLKFETTEGEWTGAQRHNNQPSKVMQLNVTPEQRQQMQAAGVDKTFDSMLDASRQSSHPVRNNTVGWVRYTQDGDKPENVKAEAEKLYGANAPYKSSWSPEELEEAKNDYIKDNTKSPSIFMDEVQSDFGQSFGKRAQAEARQQAMEELPGQVHPDYLSDLGHAANNGYMSEGNIRDKAEWLVGRHGDAMGWDVKTGENIPPGPEEYEQAVQNRMDEIHGDEASARRYAVQAFRHAKNGDFDDARNAANAAHNQGYNYQPLVELLDDPKFLPHDVNSLTPEQQQHVESKVAEARDLAEQKWPEAHQQKINEILFGGKHPNEVLHEAFHEHMRQKGHVGVPISVWSPESKARISLEHEDKPIPGHMQLTYRDVPQKMGMQPAKYGQRAAESNKEYKDDPLWSDIVRKAEPTQHVSAIAVVNPQGHLLFQKRRDNGRYTNPAGSLNPHESPEQAARRELLEETNLVPHRCEYLGSGSVPAKGITVHCFRGHVDGTPSAKNDPDKEAESFHWVDTSQGLPPEIANNLHSPDNVLLKLLGLQNDTLAKGAMQRLAPFKPHDPDQRMDPQDEAGVARWQGPDREPEDRGSGDMSTPARLRALHHLAGQTKVRKNPQTGEHEFLLHRGMSSKEYNKATNLNAITHNDVMLGTKRPDGMINHPEASSWTPKYNVARDFAHDYTTASRVYDPKAAVSTWWNPESGRVASAWVPASAIAMVPKQYGALDTAANLYEPEDYKPRVGANDYGKEHEVILHGDHNSTLATPEDLADIIKPTGSLHGRINFSGNQWWASGDDVAAKIQALRSRFGKSEELLQKAPAIWNTDRADLEDFAHGNLGPRSPSLIHEATHQIAPNLWVHKFVEPQVMKVAPSSTRRLTEYRVTPSSKVPSQDQPAIGTITGTAHQDRGQKKFRVSALAVHPRARRHGISKMLYSHMLKDNGGRAESDTLVSPDAQGFYEGLARDKKFKVKLADTSVNRGVGSPNDRHQVELSKSLKHAFMALAGAAALHAGTAQAPSPPWSQEPAHAEAVNMSPAPVKAKWGPEGLHPDLYPIAHLESNFGQKMDHAKHSKGEFHTAFGAVGLKPVTAYERYQHEPHLQTLFPGMDDEKKFVNEFKANPLFYNSIASAEWNHNKRVFGGDIHRASFAWRWGQQAAHDAPDENVIADPYVQAFEKLSNRLKSKEELVKGMRVEHYSGVDKLKTLDPKKQGTGNVGAEGQRPDRIPRTYVYSAGAKPEQQIGALPHKYQAELDPGITLYNLSKDPLGLMKPRKRKTTYGIVHEPVDLSQVERKIRRLGFHGYSHYNSAIPEAIALFHKVPVKQVK